MLLLLLLCTKSAAAAAVAAAGVCCGTDTFLPCCGDRTCQTATEGGLEGRGGTYTFGWGHRPYTTTGEQ